MGGRRSTHVANAYHETVFVKVDAERSYVLSMNFSVSGEAEGVKGSASGGATWDWNKIQVGFTRIPNGTFQRFDVEFGQGKDTAYITVITESGKLICDALPRREDKSVIVTEEGYIQDAKYGSIWQKE